MKDGRSVAEQRCEWCRATEDLVEGVTGPGPTRLLVCNDAHACQRRWPKTFPPGTVGALEPKAT